MIANWNDWVIQSIYIIYYYTNFTHLIESPILFIDTLTHVWSFLYIHMGQYPYINDDR